MSYKKRIIYYGDITTEDLKERMVSAGYSEEQINRILSKPGFVERQLEKLMEIYSGNWFGDLDLGEEPNENA